MPSPMAIYKIFRSREWADLVHDGETAGAPVDVSDGYVHFSTGTQLSETLEKHFAGATGLMILSVDETRLGDALKWEPSRGGALFPHLYRAFRLSDVTWARPVAEDGSLPEGIT